MFFLITLLTIGTIVLLIIYFIFVKKDIPFIGIIDAEWSIGVYKIRIKNEKIIISEIPNISNPILSIKNIDYKDAQFVADPFIIRHNDNFYLFFEIMRSRKGEIALAESKDGLNWKYDGIILDEPFHLSYPQVFQFEQDFYMIPESAQKKEVRLYKSITFPFEWKYVKTLLKGKEWFDSTVVKYNGTWFMFSYVGYGNLELYYSDDIFSDWSPHPQNPLIFNNFRSSRPGGSVLILNNSYIRVAQDCAERYGDSLRVFKILKLDKKSYLEKELVQSPLLKASGNGWNSIGMHHISICELDNCDNKEYLAAVDGNRKLNKPVLFFFNMKFNVSFKIFHLIQNSKKLLLGK